MNRSRIVIALVACLAAGSAQVLRADVRSEEKTRFQLAGALGKVVNFFGGKSAREGVTSTVAVKGNRKMTTTGQTGQIVDLSEEKIYDLDIKKKSYKVTTFAEVRRQMEEARKKAEEEAKKAEAEEAKETKDEPPAERDPNAKEYEVDFDIKNTGERKTVNGFDTQQSVMTITVREKGKTLEQAGGLVTTTDMWLTPTIAAMKEVQDFDLKYYQKLYGPMVAGASPQDMAAAMAMYPMIKPAMDKMAAEGSKLEGTAVLTVMTVDAVKSAEQVAAEAKESTETASSGGGGSQPASVGGLIGGFGRRMAQRRQQNQEPAAAAKDRANIMTTTHEVLKVATSVADGDVSLPAGFKEEK
jgi:hypothetical protein